MGYYINPRDMTKEQWLMENNTGKTIIPPSTPVRIIDGKKDVVICLVDNGGFTAAGVAFDDAELEAFARPNDLRAKIWFWVPVNKVEEVIGVKGLIQI